MTQGSSHRNIGCCIGRGGEVKNQKVKVVCTNSPSQAAIDAFNRKRLEIAIKAVQMQSGGKPTAS